MKSFISTAVAFLLGLAISVAAIPTPDSFDNSCVRDDCVNAADNELTLPDSAFSWKNGEQIYFPNLAQSLLFSEIFKVSTTKNWMSYLSSGLIKAHPKQRLLQ